MVKRKKYIVRRIETVVEEWSAVNIIDRLGKSSMKERAINRVKKFLSFPAASFSPCASNKKTYIRYEAEAKAQDKINQGETMKDIKEKIGEICEGTPYYVDQVVARYDALIDQLAELFEEEKEKQKLSTDQRRSFALQDLAMEIMDKDKEIAELKAELEEKHALLQEKLTADAKRDEIP